MSSFQKILPDLSVENSILIPALLKRIDELEAMGVKVQAQPIGLMRLALNNQNNAAEGPFLHIWIPGLPIQKTGGPFAHTHVFHLRSKVLIGKLTDITYTPTSDPNGAYKLVQGHCRQDYCSLSDIIDRVCMNKKNIRDIHAGQTYEVPKGIFHLTSLKKDAVVMTLMQKIDVDKADPIVAVPYHLPISNESFNRDQLDQQAAWTQIRSLLRHIV